MHTHSHLFQKKIFFFAFSVIPHILYYIRLGLAAIFRVFLTPDKFLTFLCPSASNMHLSPVVHTHPMQSIHLRYAHIAFSCTYKVKLFPAFMYMYMYVCILLSSIFFFFFLGNIFFFSLSLKQYSVVQVECK